ncbi:hypothetical protein BpHYR1_004927 [Brachionus plicatilis]|uniref:Uncharacterized protein n=1 Tax=Brachionus plicatilis TaxID=10195 RepID=A0A3M7S1C2_BRAPC|nr:hypothetical protein BpHYR1_004927 [Brachionus plicatilis]
MRKIFKNTKYLSLNEDEISEKRVQILKIQLGLMEKKVESLVDNQKNSSQTRDLKIKIIKQKLKIYNEEEYMLKKSLNEIKNENNNSVSSDVYNLAKNLGQQYLDELNEKFKIDTNIFLIEKKEELDCLVESSESDDDYLSEDTKFFDAYETPDKLNEEANKEKNQRVRKINEIKQKILNIGSKKSCLRLALKKLTESEHLDENPEKPAEPAVKTFAIRREEDKIQKEMCMENRNKAFLRLKEYKMKKMKDSKTEKPTKKPYVPKSKQRILPPNLNQKVKIFKKEEKTSADCLNDEVVSNSPIPPPPPPPLDFLPNNSIKPPAPPPLPPNISNAPLPPPPPPPPLDLLSSNSTKPSPPQAPLLISSKSEKHAKLKENSKHNERPKENTKIEFDINEIKNFKFKKSAKSPPKKEKITINQFNSWDTLMNEIRTNGGRRLKNITNEASDRKTKCDLDLPLKTKLELDLTSILSERSKFFNLDDEEGSESDASWDN